MRRLLFLLVLGVTGCRHPASLVSVCEDADVVRDDRLVGSWRIDVARQEADERPVVSFGELSGLALTITPAEAGQYDVVFSHQDTSVAFDARLAKIGDLSYLELQRSELDDPAARVSLIRPYYLIRYDVDADGVRLIGCNAAQYRSELASHGLPATDVESLCVFTGTAQQLRDLLTLEGALLYPPTARDILLRRRVE